MMKVKIFKLEYIEHETFFEADVKKYEKEINKFMSENYIVGTHGFGDYGIQIFYEETNPFSGKKIKSGKAVK